MLKNNRQLKLQKKEHKIITRMIEAGIDVPPHLTGRGLIRFGYEQVGRKPPEKQPMSMPTQHAYFDVINRALKQRNGSKKPTQEHSRLKQIAAFYRSYEWRRMRYTAIKRNDGRCQCCGSSRDDGVILHVDHIKPLRKDWELRLDPNNLQVLCHLCNHGKGNWDETDWRL